MVGERNEEKKKEGPPTFRCHAPPIKEDDRKENQMRWKKLIFHHYKTPLAPPKVCGVSHALAHARHATITVFHLKIIN